MKKRRQIDPLDEAVNAQLARTGVDLTIRRIVRRGHWEAKRVDGSKQWTFESRNRLMMELLEYLNSVPDNE